MDVFNNLWGRRNDPAIRKLLTCVYILYLLAFLEYLFLPSNGLLMLPAFAYLIGSRAIYHSSYRDHAWWLILCAFIWAIFLWKNCLIHINLYPINCYFHLIQLGWILCMSLFLYGFYHFLAHKPLLYKKQINALRLLRFR